MRGSGYPACLLADAMPTRWGPKIRSSGRTYLGPVRHVAAPAVMPPAVVAIAARPLVPRQKTYAVTTKCETGSRPRLFRQKNRREIRRLSPVFLGEFTSLFVATFPLCSLRGATTAWPQHRHFAKRPPALCRVGGLEVQNTLVFARQHVVAHAEQRAMR
jgi:hypothetical protein